MRTLFPTLFLLVFSASLHATEITLTTANDPISGNAHADDLYTAALGLGLGLEHSELALGERMFTDREAGFRFDETYAELGRALPEVAGWQPRLAVGALHVGKGLFGQSTQNWVHQVVGAEPVHLAYIEDQHWYGTARLDAARALGGGKRHLWTARAELATAPGFRSWLRGEVALDVELPADFAIRAAAGLRLDRVDFRRLDRRVPSSGTTWELAFGWRHLYLSLASNDLGTATRHITLGLTARTRSGGRNEASGR
ncbi:MAG TPA: hypothetical protein PK413_03110 [Thermoanaerobaculia bacterium]|nr:hypothetical protein [Thermoanaerobaculia bacterium]